MAGPRLLLHCWGSLHTWAVLLACELHMPILPLSPPHLPGFHPQLPGSSWLPLAFSKPHAGHTVGRQEPVWLCYPGMLSWPVHTGLCSLSWIKLGAQQWGGMGEQGRREGRKSLADPAKARHGHISCEALPLLYLGPESSFPPISRR